MNNGREGCSHLNARQTTSGSRFCPDCKLYSDEWPQVFSRVRCDHKECLAQMRGKIKDKELKYNFQFDQQLLSQKPTARYKDGKDMWGSAYADRNNDQVRAYNQAITDVLAITEGDK